MHIHTPRTCIGGRVDGFERMYQLDMVYISFSEVPVQVHLYAAIPISHARRLQHGNRYIPSADFLRFTLITLSYPFTQDRSR